MRVLVFWLTAAAALMAPQTSAFADCKCLANGRVYNHGQLACLKLPNGEQLARCDMVLNNSSWKKVRDGCPVSEVELPPVSVPHERRASDAFADTG